MLCVFTCGIGGLAALTITKNSGSTIRTSELSRLNMAYVCIGTLALYLAASAALEHSLSPSRVLGLRRFGMLVVMVPLVCAFLRPLPPDAVEDAMTESTDIVNLASEGSAPKVRTALGDDSRGRY